MFDFVIDLGVLGGAFEAGTNWGGGKTWKNLENLERDVWRRARETFWVFFTRKDRNGNEIELEASDVKNEEHDYNLQGVVCHIGGTASSGHYTANCQRIKKKTIESRICFPPNRGCS